MPVGLYTLKDIIAAIVKDRAASSAGDKTKQKQVRYRQALLHTLPLVEVEQGARRAQLRVLEA